MKRILLICMAAVLLTGTFWVSNAGADGLAFVPEMLVLAYNEALDDIFGVLLDDDPDDDVLKQFVEFSTVEYNDYSSQYDNIMLYCNKNATIAFVFGADGKYDTASNVMFSTSLKDDNPVKNLPQLALAYAVSTLDSDCDFESFLFWVNDDEDDTFFCNSFFAYRIDEPYESSAILLTKL